MPSLSLAVLLTKPFFSHYLSSLQYQVHICHRRHYDPQKIAVVVNHHCQGELLPSHR